MVLALTVYVYGRVTDVLVYKWDWSFLPGFFLRFDEETGSWQINLLIKGLLTTIRLSIWAMILASIIGLIMGLCRTSKILFLRLVSRAYVELIRNIPPLVFIFIFYFFISSQIGLFDAVELWVRGASPEARAFIERQRAARAADEATDQGDQASDPTPLTGDDAEDQDGPQDAQPTVHQ